MNRRAFTLIEVLVALSLLVLLIGARLAFLRPVHHAVTPRLSQASALLREVADLSGSLSRRDLYAAINRGAEAENDYHEVAWTDLGLSAKREIIADLDARLYVRVLEHALGAYGLDRVDLCLAYKDGRGDKYAALSVVRRRSELLAAVSDLRLSSIDRATPEQAQVLIQDVLREGAVAGYGRRHTSGFLVPEYPDILRRFDQIGAGSERYADFTARSAGLSPKLEPLFDPEEVVEVRPLPAFTQSTAIAN